MRHLLLAVLVAVAVFAYTHAETTCQSHRRSSGTPGSVVKWNIECDENGDYKPLQCMDEPQERRKFCACYNKEKSITAPSTKTRTCVCPLKADEISNTPNVNPCDIPTCVNTGKFKPQQHCLATGKYHCVNPETGERTTEPTTDSNVQCPA